MDPNSVSTEDRLLHAAPEILRRWERRVRAEIPAARGQHRRVLRNNLESLLGEVARKLSPESQAEILREGLTLSQDHGDQRANLTPYGISELFLEYRLLRQTLLEILDEERQLSADERETINLALEHAAQEAVTQFARIQQKADRRRLAQARELSAELRTAYERERHIAQILQRPLLLQVAEDTFPGLSIATWYEPAGTGAEVGGDFLDVFALPDGRVALVVGDACGKGLEAAAHNTHVKDVLRAFLRENSAHPGRTLSRVNEVVCDTLQLDYPTAAHIFIVVALAVLVPRTGEIRFAAAGAESPVILRAHGEAEVVQCHGMVLGVLPERLYEERSLNLEPGDSVLMVTDGITEARHQGVLLGHDGMVQLALQTRRGAGVSEVCQAILAGARACGGGSLQDDASLILVRRR